MGYNSYQIKKSVDLLFDNSSSSLKIVSEVTERINAQNEKLENITMLFQEPIGQMREVSGAIEEIALALVNMQGIQKCIKNDISK